MSNFAALVSPLSISGSRLTDGTANASGTVYFFQPGGNTPVNVYANAAATTIVTQPVTLGAGGKLPTQYAAGIFTTQPVRILIQDADTNTVTDNVFIPATAGNVGVDNAGFTDSTLDDVLTDAFTSFGGTDWKYKESGGATSRTIHDKFQEQGIWVTDFADVDPTGTSVSTTGIQAALNRAKAQSCNLYFPDGTFKIDQALTLSSATGVRIIGAGMGATTITSTHATANMFTLSSCTACGFEGFNAKNSGTSTGAVISLTSCTETRISYVGADAFGAGTGQYRYCIDTATACHRATVTGCIMFTNPADASARTIRLDASNLWTFTSCDFTADTGYSVEFIGTAGTHTFVGCSFNDQVRFAVGATGSGFTFVGGTIAVGLSIATATYRDIRIFGAKLDGYTEDVASAGTFTPNLAMGRHFRVRAASTGAAITIAAPTPTPTAIYGLTIILDIFNNAGGAISNPYTMNAVYHLATVPNQTDLNHNVYTLEWDPSASVWRQLSLSVTT